MESEETFSIATLLDRRYKNNYFRSNTLRDKAKDRLKELLRLEMLKLPEKEADILVESNETTGNNNSLAAMFAKVKNSVNNNPMREVDESAERILEEFFKAKLEDSNLSGWRKYEEEGKDSRKKQTLSNLAKFFLAPPPTSTQTERLFSVAGNIVNNRPRQV